MRNIWMVAVVAAVAGCEGGIGTQPWDKNHDGLIAACEGLSSFFCGATAGCESQPVACLAVCRDDGKGGCQSPCAEQFQCVPKAPPRCQDLSPRQCSADSRCIQSPGACPKICEPDGSGGCKPCNAVPTCQPRAPEPQPACALIPIGVCALVPACHVETQTSCPPESPATSDGGETGVSRGGCWGPGSCTTTQICVNTTPSPSCESTPIGSCTANPSCELQAGACEIACLVGPCPPCVSSPRCVTRPIASCETRSVTDCNSDPSCVIETTGACLAVCEPDGSGGCKPCAPPSRCVSVVQPAPLPQPAPAPPPTK